MKTINRSFSYKTKKARNVLNGLEICPFDPETLLKRLLWYFNEDNIFFYQSLVSTFGTNFAMRS